MQKLFQYLLLAFFFLGVFVARANHVIGGSLTMTQLDKVPGKYKITLNLLINIDHFEAGEANNMLSEIGYVRVIRKKDNFFLPVPLAKFDKFEALIYDNPACENTNGLQIKEYRYVANVQWDVNDFDDDGGYYLVYERCCRDKNIKNIRFLNDLYGITPIRL